MGFFNKCFCCCCLPEESSVKVCTWVFLIFEILFVILLKLNETFTLLNVIDIVAIVVLILLIYGIKNKNKEYLSKYNITFGIFTTLEIILLAYYIITIISVCLYDFDDEYLDSFIDDLANSDEPIIYTRENAKKLLLFSAICIILVISFLIFILVDYYFTTRHYVNKLIESIDNSDSNRKYENGL
ncbi:hypothetical protein BCR36DRAFT_415267 [Piromyces finnis]|uniref:MARVEL domain-containing protein n=1 Tax=Piromyces finnis TaxID=1754191 RepID=A0A1Y1V0P3_9FUNG|nr:hypothetical protein BCR36DRAFT_415267 [Piromyces finnis]|eukprot:ORX43899.1 hypothetical protein BCR36DRAFT_415267 [Piromyces finnis]